VAISLAEHAGQRQLVTVNGTGIGDGWRLDTRALERACTRLALALPIIVHVTNGRGGRRRGGMHWSPARTNAGHRIAVLRWSSPEYASRALWHELEHAAQYEAAPRTFDADYAAETRARGYRDNRFEIGARRAERRHDVWFALVSA
jgi:hypothetical protein